jgi:hypothetical protein
MTSTSDLNIAGSPIYESLVATTGDPYQPPAYQLPDVYGSSSQVAAYADGSGGGSGNSGWDSGTDWGSGGGPNWNGALPPNAGPEMLSQFLGRMLGDGQSWVAVMIFGGPIAEQLRQQQVMQQFGPIPQYGPPGPSGYANVPGYGFGSSFGYGSNNVPGGGMPDGAMAQAYQQAYQWAAQQQAALAASQAATAFPALTAGPEPVAVPIPDAPPALPPAEATQFYGGMLDQDWAGWLGQTAQGARPQQEQGEEVLAEPPYETRGGGLSSRLGAAMRELRGR